MPAETLQRGCSPGTEKVLALLWLSLGDPDLPAPGAESRTLARPGVDAEDLMGLWAAVGEGFGGRSLGPETDIDVLDPAMTVTTAAAAMATPVAGDGRDASC